MRLPSFRSLSLFLLVFCSALLPAFAQSGLVISQVYGGGGNSGAPYTYDYLELYNPTGSDISLNGFSFQYASSAGTSWNTVTLPNDTVPSGHYYLIQGAAGSASPGPLPVTPDFVATTSVNQSSIPNFSGTTGKIALVNGTTPLTGSCPATNSNVIDFIGYGTANCYLGTAAAPAPSNTTADIRTDPTVNTHNNSADYTTGTPNPHNLSYGSTGTGLSGTGTANPATLTSGSTVLLTVTVHPATSPVASTGITVVGDLSLIGGSATQIFYDDGTHGDATAGDNIFSFSATATASSSGAVQLPIKLADAQSDTATTSIVLTVNVPVMTLPIHTIQGSKSLTSTSISPYVGQTVSTTGIVTGVGSAGYFIQSRDVDADNDPTTPEGIYVYAGSGKVPAEAVIGNYVQVTGSISTYPSAATSHTPATELNSTTAALITANQPLPTATTLTTSMLTPHGGIYQLTPYEGMRVSVPSLTSISGTDGNLTEKTETITSNGQFYAVITGTPRPFREPGIDIRDPQTNLPLDVAEFDDNPERILVDSKFLGGTAIDLSTNATLTNVTGILDFTYSSDSFYDPSRLVLDKSYASSNVTAGMTVQPVPASAANEFTVAAYNIERFFNTDSSDDIDYNPVTGKTEKSSAVDVTQAAYNTRLAKVSLAIRNVLGTPDIVTLEEPENQSVVADIAKQISADAQAAGQPDPQYVAYGTGTTYAPYSNDASGISVGFLVKPSRVDTVSITQEGADTLFTDPRDNTTQQTLNDRPPLVLQAGIKRSGATDYPVTVIVNHLRSLLDENDPSSGVFTRAKKELQAEFLAKLIQQHQSAGEHVIAVGDYNAFEFSDGYIDILATVTNTNVLPATQVVEPGMAGLVTPSPTDMALLLAPTDRWSYQEYGNAQILDHIVATSDLIAGGAHMVYAHLDADQPLIAYNDPTTPARTSDHDAAVGYFTIPPVTTGVGIEGLKDFGMVTVGTSSSPENVTLKNTGNTDIAGIAITTTGDFSATNNCPDPFVAGTTCSVNITFTPSAPGARDGRLLISSTNTNNPFSIPLSGTGVGVPDFTVVDGKGNTTTTLTVTAGSTGTLPLSFTSVNGFSASVTVTCAILTGTPPSGVTCTPPASFTLSGSASVTQNVTFTTTARTAASGIAIHSGMHPWQLVILIGATGALMLCVLRVRKLARFTGLVAVLILASLAQIGCGGGSHSSSGGNGGGTTGTPAGSYAYNITVTSGSISHTETVILVVQ